MRLFKRPSTSPLLVSATAIPQDIAGFTGVEENTENAKEASINVNPAERSPKPENEDSSSGATPGSSSSFSARKGISTWGRKVGRKWDQLKRSDSTELLSVSGRRRRWSPNRKSLCEMTAEHNKSQTEVSPNTSFGKPKRISRVESLRNLFRATERGASTSNLHGHISKREGAIEEEDDLSHYKMDKALSEGALRNVKQFRQSSYEFQTETLIERKRQLSESIQNLQEQQRVFDYILDNQEILKTEKGMSLVRDTLKKTETSVRNYGNGITDDRPERNIAINASQASAKSRDSAKMDNAKRNLFSNSDSERNEQRRSFNGSGLEDLMCTLRLGCDESGYDSDSTRAGADSPDSEKAVPAMLKPRSFSITSDDYQGIDLSLMPIISPKKKDDTTNSSTDAADITLTDNAANHSHIDDVSEKSTRNSDYSNRDISNDCKESKDEDPEEAESSVFNESIRTEMTLVSDDDTDSCNEDTFEELRFEACHRRGPDPKVNANLDSRKMISANAKNNDELIATNNNIPKTPIKRVNARIPDTMPMNQRVRLQNLQKQAKNQSAVKGRKVTNASVLNLLDNAASPCKDSPPATKVPSVESFDCVQYYSPKRSRSNMEGAGGTEVTQLNPPKRPVIESAPPSTKTLIRRELKTIKLQINRSCDLGMKIEKRDAARSLYVVAKLEENGAAAKSKQIRVGDEVVRICGRRLRGMSSIDARAAMKNLVGTIELQIAREPTYNFDGDLDETWSAPSSKTCNDSEVWTRHDEMTKKIARNSDVIDYEMAQEASNTCQIVGALTKCGKSVSMHTMNSVGHDFESGSKMTGMKKFQVMRKRSSMPAARTRRTTSLTTDLLTVVLEKGATKKLGFSIVGGTDSNKGSMGIYVKEVMTGGQAAEEGTLQAGDEILAINGQPMEGLTHAKALQFFKAAKPGKLILYVGRRDATHKRFLGHSKSYDCLDKLTECGEE